MGRTSRSNRMDDTVIRQHEAAAETAATAERAVAKLRAEEITRARVELKQLVPLLIKRLDELGGPGATRVTIVKERHFLIFPREPKLTIRAAWKLHEITYMVRSDPFTGHVYLLSNGMLSSKTCYSMHETSIDEWGDPVTTFRAVQELAVLYDVQ